MIDRQAYRNCLHSLTDSELIRIGVGVCQDYARSTRANDPVMWEWDDIASECVRRGPELLARLQELYELEKRQPSETARQFLDRSKRQTGD